MFEAVDLDRDQFVERAVVSGRSCTPIRKTQAAPSDAVVTVLEAGFRTKVMSWRSAYDLGARSALSLVALRTRTEHCAEMIRAGLGCAVDEPLFAALVYHHPELARKLARSV